MSLEQIKEWFRFPFIMTRGTALTYTILLFVVAFGMVYHGRQAMERELHHVKVKANAYAGSIPKELEQRAIVEHNLRQLEIQYRNGNHTTSRQLTLFETYNRYMLANIDVWPYRQAPESVTGFLKNQTPTPMQWDIVFYHLVPHPRKHID